VLYPAVGPSITILGPKILPACLFADVELNY